MRKLALKNFRSHCRTEVTFQEGITAIIGPNGAGKTSILEGIAYALYPELFRGRMDSLVRRGAADMMVALEFSAGGVDYMVERRRTPRGPEARLYRREGGRWVPIHFGQKEVSLALRDILGVSPEIFLNAVYVREGDLLGFLTSRPASRKEIIAKLLGAEELKPLVEALGEAVKKFGSRAAELEARLEELRRMRERKERLRLEIDSARRELEEVGEELSKTRGELEAVTREIELMEEKRERYIALKERIRSLEEDAERMRALLREKRGEAAEAARAIARVKELRETARLVEPLERLRLLREKRRYLIEKVKRVGDLEGELERLRARRDELAQIAKRGESIKREVEQLMRERERLSSAVREARRIEEEEKEILRKISRAREILKELAIRHGLRSAENVGDLLKEAAGSVKREISELEGRAASLRLRIEKMSASLEKVEAYLSGLTESEGVCPLCGTKLDPGRAAEISERLKKDVEKLREERESAERELKGVEERLSKLRNTVEELRSDAEMAEELETDVASLEEKAAELREKIEGSRKAAKALEEIENRIREAERLLELSLSASGELKHIEKRVEALTAELSKARREALLAETELSVVDREEGEILENLGLEIENLDEELSKARLAARKVEELEGSLERYREIMGEVRRIERELKRVEEALEGVKREIEALDFSEDDYQRTVTLRKALEARLKEAEGRRREIIGRVTEMEKMLEEVKRALSEERKLRREAEKIRRFVEILESLRKAFGRDGVQKIIRERVRPLVEAYSNEFLSRFGLGYDRLILDEDWNSILMRGREKVEFSSLSGGERVCVALSVRAGLAKAIGGGAVQSLIMDEPTIHLDQHRRGELIAAIREIGLPQVVVVTHSADFEGAADYVYLVEKKGGISVLVEGLSLGKVNEGRRET